MSATKVVGAIIGVSMAVSGYVAVKFAAVAPVQIECTDAKVFFAPDDNAMRIDLTCHAGEAPVILTIPDIPPF